jgi:hypothetical protein
LAELGGSFGGIFFNTPSTNFPTVVCCIFPSTSPMEAFTKSGANQVQMSARGEPHPWHPADLPPPHPDPSGPAGGLAAVGGYCGRCQAAPKGWWFSDGKCGCRCPTNVPPPAYTGRRANASNRNLARVWPKAKPSAGGEGGGRMLTRAYGWVDRGIFRCERGGGEPPPPPSARARTAARVGAISPTGQIDRSTLRRGLARGAGLRRQRGAAFVAPSLQPYTGTPPGGSLSASRCGLLSPHPRKGSAAVVQRERERENGSSVPAMQDKFFSGLAESLLGR